MEHFLDGINMIYWINLDRAKDRKQKMEEMFNDEVFHGMNVERFSAFDYKKGNILNNFKIMDRKYKNTEPEYACFLSHLGTINKFSQTNLSDDSVALIFEDDVTIEYKKYWKKSIKEILNSAPKDWEIIMLNYHFDFGYSPSVNLFKDFELNNRRFYSALSYIIKKSSAKKLMNEMYSDSDNMYYLDPKIRTHHADGYLFDKLRTYIYKYPYFTYKTENTSFLHPEHLDNHKRSKLHIQKLLYGEKGDNILDNIVEGFSFINQQENREKIEKIISIVFIILLSLLFVYTIYTKKKQIIQFLKHLKI